MTAAEIWALAERLAKDDDLHSDYLIRTMGLDPSIPSEVTQATGILTGKGLISESTDGTYSAWPHTCVMTSNFTSEEYLACMQLDSYSQ